MFAISPTDVNWFYNNKVLNQSNQINFWTPTPWNIKKLSPENKLYFMLKSPIRKIGGFGLFKGYSNLTILEAWNRFGYGNGVNSKTELTKKLQKYLKKNTSIKMDVESHKIGCIELSECEFWEEDQFVDLNLTSLEFKRNIVKIKYFDEYDTIMNYFKSFVKDFGNFDLITLDEKLNRKSFKTIRVGQSEFRKKLLKAYGRRCCISGNNCEELLEAAHIQPYINKDSNHIQNGLLLRNDFHKLFDTGLLSIDMDYTIHISKRLTSTYYKSFNLKRIQLPKNSSLFPSKIALANRALNFRK